MRFVNSGSGKPERGARLVASALGDGIGVPIERSIEGAAWLTLARHHADT